METGNRIIRIRQVMEITGLAKPTIYLHMKQCSFPKQIKLGPKAAGRCQKFKAGSQAGWRRGMTMERDKTPGDGSHFAEAHHAASQGGAPTQTL